MALAETAAMLKWHYAKAQRAVNKVDETIQTEKLEGKIRVLSEKELEKVMKEENVAFSRLDLVFNLDSPSSKNHLIHDFTRKI